MQIAKVAGADHQTPLGRLPAVRGRLADYYRIAFLNSIAATLVASSVYFWARLRFGFGDAENLLLGALGGLVYATSAWWGGRWADRAGLDRTLKTTLPILVWALGVVPFLADRRAPYVLVVLHSAIIGPAWPALEGAILHVPHPMRVPRRLGIYNVVWSTGNALALFLGGVLIEWHADAVIWGAGLIHALACAVSWGQPRKNLACGEKGMAFTSSDQGARAPDGNRRRLVVLAWVGNALAYVVLWIFFAALPHLAERMGWRAGRTLWLAIALYGMRSLMFAILWRWEGWQDRLGWSVAALWAGPLAIAACYLRPHPVVVLPALLLAGAAFGLTYSASLYYTLDAGHEKASLGGQHEALIGLGAGLGPLVGSAAVHLTGDTTGGLFVVLTLVAAVTASAILWTRPRSVRAEGRRTQG